jgi:signal transduction histidine kinase/sugar lactone lactonase YvrE
LWAGTDGGGLNRYDEETDSWQRSKHQASNEHSLGSDVVISIAEDQDGNLWIGNYTGGLHFLDRHVSGFSHVGMRPDGLGLIHDSVLSFLEDTDGVLWVGTEGGLSRFDHLEGSAVHYRHDPHDPSSLSANAVLALERDSRGRLWVGTYFGGLNLLDERNGRFEHFQHAADDPDTLSGSNVWAVHEDSRGLLWVGTMNGLNRFDEENGVFVRYLPDLTNATALRHGITWRIHEDSQQRLWFCTQSGLSLYDRENDAFTHFVDLPHLSVATAFDDSQGRLWVGTRGGGLSRLDLQTGKIETFRTKDGLPSDVVVGILEDARGRLWLSTNSGISRFDPETRTFQSYDAGDGLRGSQFNRNAYLKTARGELLFGGLHGFNHFFPDQIQDNPHIPPVHLTEFKVFNTPARVGPDAPLAVPITQADQITLTYDQSVFSFGFAALGYRNPAKNRYAYRLVGFDRDWVQSGDRRTATYTNLDPGSYVFQVKASNDSGVWNDEGTSIRLTITPPFWRTRWFEALAALSLLTALVGLYRARTGYIRSRNRALQREIAQRRRAEEDREQLLTQMERSNTQLEVSNTELEARNTELERFAHAITHDLRSPLVTIRGFLGFLEMDTLAGDTNRVKQDIQRISTATERLRELFEELVELSKVGRLANPLPRVDIGELAREALALVQGEVRDSGVRVAIADDLPTVRADHVRLREVLQNLLENAVKFMGDQADPLIEIGATCTEGEVVCYVRDNGVGIDPRFHEQIFEMFDRLDADTPGTGIGLTLVKRIVEVHGGRIWVESEGEGRGAAFYFSLPQRNANGAPGDV